MTWEPGRQGNLTAGWIMATGTKRGCHGISEDFSALTSDRTAIIINAPNSYLDFHKYSRLCQGLLSLWPLHYSVLLHVMAGAFIMSPFLHRQHHFSSSSRATSPNLAETSPANPKPTGFLCCLPVTSWGPDSHAVDVNGAGSQLISFIQAGLFNLSFFLLPYFFFFFFSLWFSLWFFSGSPSFRHFSKHPLMFWFLMVKFKQNLKAFSSYFYSFSESFINPIGSLDSPYINGSPSLWVANV